MTDDRVLHLVERDRPSDRLLERRDAQAGEAARHDQVEVREVRAHVERKAVARHPAGDADADGTNLRRARRAGIQPGASHTFDAPCREAIIGTRPHHHFFDVPHVAVHVAPVGPQIDDGVPHDLPGPVIGHVPPAAGLVDVDAESRQPLGSREDVGAPAVALDAERDDRGMLQEQQRVWNAVSLAFPHELELQCACFGVTNRPEPPYVELAER